MNFTDITIKKSFSVFVPNELCYDKNSIEKQQIVSTLIAEAMQLGFNLSIDLIKELQNLKIISLEKLSIEIINTLKQIKGDDVTYTPMYPNFPEQVMEATDSVLFYNAILHYMSGGNWLPLYQTIKKQYVLENINYITIELATVKTLNSIFKNLIETNDSLSKTDKKILSILIKTNMFNLKYYNIPFKENLCAVADILVNNSDNGKLSDVLKTTTDILRYCVFLSGCDISLKEKIKFKSFKRKQRKNIIAALELVINNDDIKRHKDLWIKLFHGLHVGDFSKKYPNVFKIANEFRNKNNVITTSTLLEKNINERNLDETLKYISIKPGEFARRLCELLTKFNNDMEREFIVKRFMSVIQQISTKVLLQLFSSVRSRKKEINKRVVFPKGNISRALVIKNKLPALSHTLIEKIITGIALELQSRNEEEKDTFFINEDMKLCPIPTGMRSSSDGLFQTARGTRFPLDENKNTIRFFIYWIGQDIDLSCTFHDKDFNIVDNVSYTNLRSSNYAFHSGDITSATYGASEFIDIDLTKLSNDIDYISMNVLVFSGPTFKEHSKVYAGWMLREHPKSNEIYNPKTVKNKLDLTQNSKNMIPIVIDVKNKKIINVDLQYNNKHKYANNVQSNNATIQEILSSIIDIDNRPSIYDLFVLKGFNLVDKKEDANVIVDYAENGGDITPYDVNLINSEYLK